MAVLHRLKLVHTDLKPENILLCSNDSKLSGPRVSHHLPPVRKADPKVKGSKSKSILRNTDIRLIDFGSATFESEYHSSVVSTRHYRAPEIILGEWTCDNGPLLTEQAFLGLTLVTCSRSVASSSSFTPETRSSKRMIISSIWQ